MKYARIKFGNNFFLEGLFEADSSKNTYIIQDDLFGRCSINTNEFLANAQVMDVDKNHENILNVWT
jgi:2-phospho-L-lactate guanylyltransferase (CobY/MobA/RfbA family)